MKILFAASAAEAFDELPPGIKIKAAGSFELLRSHPRMYPVRRRGIMRGYRYFIAGTHLVYYSFNSEEVRVTAIIPGVMRRA